MTTHLLIRQTDPVHSTELRLSETEPAQWELQSYHTGETVQRESTSISAEQARSLLHEIDSATIHPGTMPSGWDKSYTTTISGVVYPWTLAWDGALPSGFSDLIKPLLRIERFMHSMFTVPRTEESIHAQPCVPTSIDVSHEYGYGLGGLEIQVYQAQAERKPMQWRLRYRYRDLETAHAQDVPIASSTVGRWMNRLRTLNPTLGHKSPDILDADFWTVTVRYAGHSVGLTYTEAPATWEPLTKVAESMERFVNRASKGR